jgi:hypothetical protein
MLKPVQLAAVAAIAITPVVIVATASGADPYSPYTPTTAPTPTPTPTPTPAPLGAPQVLSSTEAAITAGTENLTYTLLIGSRTKHAKVTAPIPLSGIYILTYSAKVPVIEHRRGKSHKVSLYRPIAIGRYNGRPQALTTITLDRTSAGASLYKTLKANDAKSLHVQMTASVAVGGKTASTGTPLVADLDQ